MSLDVTRLRADFPLLARTVHGRPLVYLDNASTTQKPACVLDAMSLFYRETNANVHRGIHALSEAATDQYEGARSRLARWIGASADEIVFTRNTTEAINLVAQSFLAPRLALDDEILVTELEHHSNIVPWQIAAARAGARVAFAPIERRTDGEISLTAATLGERLSKRTRLVAITHTSNALGVRLPVTEIARLCRERGVPLVVDGAQAAGHVPVDVRALECDFFACSGHKMLGPTGIGLLWARREHWQKMTPFLGGGEMIARVTRDGFTPRPPPHGFEAGTPAIAEAVALARAVDYLDGIGLAVIAERIARLGARARAALARIDGVRVLGGASSAESGIVSISVDGVHPHDLATLLDLSGVAVRAGDHCCQPLMEALGVDGTVRLSAHAYNTEDEIDQAARAVVEAVEALAR